MENQFSFLSLYKNINFVPKMFVEKPIENQTIVGNGKQIVFFFRHLDKFQTTESCAENRVPNRLLQT